jgi:hypothetical protein
VRKVRCHRASVPVPWLWTRVHKEGYVLAKDMYWSLLLFAFYMVLHVLDQHISFAS